MEAAPRLSMLHFSPKFSPDNSDFLLKLKKLIRTNYQEDPDTFAKELEEIGALRSKSCIRPMAEISVIAALKKYYCQLHFLQSRFKISGDSEDGPFAFPWMEVYSGVMFTYCYLHYEMASVLYNVGALHTALGAKLDRSDSEGMKLACTHFQCSAWAFQTITEKFRTENATDLSPELLMFLSQICLAQAQECILEKSILDSRKAGIIAKVGAQVAEYYSSACKRIETSNAKTDLQEDTILEVVGKELSKSWTVYAQFKSLYYTAVSYFYMGVNSEESSQMGMAVAYFGLASNTLNEAGNLVKHLSPKMVDKEAATSCLIFTSDVIDAKHENAKKENEFIYHDKVPEADSLPELKGASLVKGIGFEITDPEISGTDIFSRLVPLEAHEASSLYSEEKARLLRVVGEMIEDKDAELAVFMSSLKLEEIPNPGDHLALPQEVIECAAGLSAKVNAVQKLTEAMSRIAAVSADVQASLNEIKEMLENEDEQQSEYEVIIGKRPTPISADLSREYKKYKEAHSMALDSNATLHKAMQLHLGNLKLLSLPLQELQSSIPSMADLGEEEEASIAEVQRIMKKVEDMRSERHELCEEFRLDVLSDDITKKLVQTKDSDMSDVFAVELQKHDPRKKIIEQNLYAQRELLDALTDANAKYADTRRTVADLILARNEMVGSLVASFYAYDDLLVKAAKGLEFYAKLDTNVSKLLARVKAVVSVQQEERDAILAKHTPSQLADYPPFTPYVPQMISSALPTAPPTAPPNFDMEDEPEEKPSNAESSAGGKPTLKDYLNAMKKTNSTPRDVYAVMNNLQHTKAEEVVKPVELEQTQQQPEKTECIPMVHHHQRDSPSLTKDSSNADHPASSPVPNPNVSSYSWQPNSGNPYYSSHQFANFGHASQFTPMSYPQPTSFNTMGSSPQPNIQASNMGYQHQAAALVSSNAKAIPSPSPVSSQNMKIAADTSRQPSPMLYPSTTSTPVQGVQMNTEATFPTPSKSVPSSSEAFTQASTMTFLSPSPNQMQSSFRADAASKGPIMSTSVAPTNSESSSAQAPKAGYPGGNGTNLSGQTPGYAYQPIQTNPSFHMPQNMAAQNMYYASQPSSSMQMTPTSQTITSSGYAPQQQMSPGMPYFHPYPNMVRQPFQSMLPVSNQQMQVSSLPTYSQSQMAAQSQVMSQAGNQMQHPPMSSLPTYSQSQKIANSEANKVTQYSYQSATPVTPVTFQQRAPSQAYSQASFRPQMGVPSHPQTMTAYPTFYQQTPGGNFTQYRPPTSINNVLQNQGQGYNIQAITSATTSVAPIASFQPFLHQSYANAPQRTEVVKMRPIVPQPGSMTPMNYGPPYQMSPQNRPIQSPFQPISPAPPMELNRRSSLEEMLSDDLSIDSCKENVEVLLPKVMTQGEIEEQKKEAQAKEDIAKAAAQDPYDNETVLSKLLLDTETLEAKLNDKTGFEAAWREVNSLTEKSATKTISIARCYPMKNRLPDVLPFDHTRVELPTTKDDYINASHMKGIADHAPKFIATQSPTSKTLTDFWAMVWQESVESIVCLLPEVDFIYWPQDRKEPIKVEPSLEITLQSCKADPLEPCIERIFTVMNKTTNTSRVVIHMQLRGNLNPSKTVESVVKLAATCLVYHQQQRVMGHPILVHCLAGSGKTAVFILIVAAMAEMKVGHIPDVIQMASHISQQRKGILKEKEHFKQAMQGIIRHAKDLLVKKGKILPEPSSARSTDQPNITQDLGDFTQLSSQLGLAVRPAVPGGDDSCPLEKQISDKKKTGSSTSIFSPDLSKLADLSVSSTSPQRKKVTKQDFNNSKGIKLESNPDDPLSQLDPLWSLK